MKSRLKNTAYIMNLERKTENENRKIRWLSNAVRCDRRMTHRAHLSNAISTQLQNYAFKIGFCGSKNFDTDDNSYPTKATHIPTTARTATT